MARRLARCGVGGAEAADPRRAREGGLDVELAQRWGVPASARELGAPVEEALAVPLLVRPFWEAMVLSFIFLLVLGSGLLFLASRRRRPRSSERS